MKPHNQATWSFGKMLAVVAVLAVCVGLAMGGGDGAALPDFSKFSKAFDVKDRDDEPAPKPKRSKKPRPADEPPPMTCDGDQCWWTEQGRPK